MKYSLLEVYNRVILSMKLAQFTCGLCDSMDTFSERTTEVLFRAMSVYLLSALLFKCLTSETVFFMSNLQKYVAGLYTYAKEECHVSTLVCGMVRNTDKRYATISTGSG